MVLEESHIAEFARRLDEAEQTRSLIGAPSGEAPGLTMDDAYKVQAAWVDMKLARGRTIVGYKIGATSAARRREANVSEPNFGCLLDDTQWDDGAEIPVDRFIAPRVELELAFVLGRDLATPKCSIFDVLSATDYVVPAVELVDLRIHAVDPATKAVRTITDTVCDNAANGGLILGGRPIRPDDIDMRSVPGLCYRNGAVEESGVSAAVMNHPANAVAWLARKLHAHGTVLKAGEVVLSGAFLASVPARAGDSFHADFGSCGVVGFRFV